MKKQKLGLDRLPIEKVCPPPLIEILLTLQEPVKLPDCLNPAQKLLVNLIDENWAIITWWILYERCPAIDIRYSPYNTPSFRSMRGIAQLLDKQMDLCKGVFEDDGTPLRYWLELMKERRQADIDTVFLKSVPKFGVRLTRDNEKIYQPGYIDCCRYLLKSLKDERIVPEDLRNFPNHYRLFSMALKLAWKTPKSRKCQKFRELYWNPFLAALHHYIADVEERPELGIANECDGKIYLNTRGKPKILSVKNAVID